MLSRSYTILVALVLACWCASLAHAEAPEQLDALLAKLAKVEGLSAEFQEEKRMSLLAVPLRSEGRLYYQKPRSLARHTLKPEKSSVLLQGDVVRFGSGKRSESIQLAEQPAVRMLVDTFVSVLAGDKQALLRLATLHYEEPTADSWRIRVVPKDEKLRRIARSMSFEGEGTSLTRMELTDGHGDVTVTVFSQLRFGKLAPAQAKNVFRIGG